MSNSTRTKPEEIIDVDALPEWNHRRPHTVLQHAAMTPFRRHGRPVHGNRTIATIDLTTMDDSDSDISILSFTTKSGGSGTAGPSDGKEKEMNFPSAIENIRKHSRPTANSSSLQSYYRTTVPPAKKLKFSTPPPASREQSTTGAKFASGSNSNNNNEPVSTITTTSTLSLSEVYLKFTQGLLSSDGLAGRGQTMMAQLDPHSLPPSSRPTTITATASSSNRRKDKGKRVIACIELSSDGEVELLAPKKRQKHTAPPSSSREPIAGLSTAIDVRDSDLGSDSDLDVESDEESKYDYIHAGYDLHDPDIWTPMPNNLNRPQEDEGVLDNMEHLAISEPDPGIRRPPRYVHPDISRWYPSPPKNSFPPIYIWDKLRIAKNLRYPARARPTPLQPLNKPFTRPWDLDFNLHRLKAVHSFKESPGSINRIEQKGEWTIVASACTGGLPDTVGEQLSPYNRPGSLITWRSRLDIPDGHQLKRGENIKHYAVHDLKFFPNRTSFVSTGADGAIRLWNLDDGDDVQHDVWFNQRLRTFNASPHDLTFKPETSILALAEKKIHVFTFQDAQFGISADFLFYPSRSPHVIGSLAWGFESTADQLFGSSEPCFSGIFEGVHKALDVTTKRSLYQFDASEAGDMLSLDTTGATLALSTRAPENKHLLRIYDIRRKLPTATHLLELKPFPILDEFEGEVNNASFSPDGMYLALARNDNRTHVYDQRMWGRGVIFEYDHGGESKAASRKDVYGVVKAQWVQSQATRRMALVTGGEDGCVRMWDPTMAAQNPKNGKVLAEVNSDIGHFSVGDPYAGENQLVVGDNTGEVTIFNNVVI